MCTALFLLDVHPSILFLLVFNRDEFYQRWARLISQQCIHRSNWPFYSYKVPAHSGQRRRRSFWEDKPGILAGRDLVGGGTWLGVTRTGRFAFLTNFREVKALGRQPTASARGSIQCKHHAWGE